MLSTVCITADIKVFADVGDVQACIADVGDVQACKQLHSALRVQPAHCWLVATSFLVGFS